MKRAAIPLQSVAELDSLLRAVYRAARGKHQRPDVQAFFLHLDRNLERLARDILAGGMPYGRFRRFTIRDPKPRVIHAACFEDRVFHHALMDVAGPVLERALTPTTFACRKGMGHHAAVRAVQRHLRRFPWYVKIDVARYFDTIDHRCLNALLQRRFKGPDLLAMFRRIIDGYHVAPGRGLPIGSLSSQHFANYYLDGLDRCLLQRLPARAQVRYMDDVVWWCDTRAEARETLAEVIEYAARERRLQIKHAIQINRSVHGVAYCGYRITPGQLRLSRRRRRRYVQLRRRWEQAFAEGHIDAATLQRAYDAVHSITLPAGAAGWRRQSLQRHAALEL